LFFVVELLRISTSLEKPPMLVLFDDSISEDCKKYSFSGCKKELSSSILINDICSLEMNGKDWIEK
jgi:sorbitol-specific phosphotransferase system component IIA